ncbi:MAG TPA: GFA family protein [Polyangiaceae bacterium]|nr:GFA family protein [Polyangiaceae bacterium]
MGSAKKYEGGCHCGKVRYEVMAEIDSVLACNCSICSKKAHLLAFVPADAFTLLKGEDELSDYQFNKKNIHHLFCRTCGISSYGTGTGKDGKTMYSINVRCLDGVKVDELSVQHFDGAKV